MEMRQYSKQLVALLTIITGLYTTISANITGVVVDGSNNPLDGAAVVALQPADSTYISGSVTDQTGRFLLEIPEGIGNLILTTKAIGYDKQDLTAKNGDEVRIALTDKTISLSEVTVRPTITTVSPGKFSFIPGDLAKYSPNAFQALEIVPLLSVDIANDKLEIIGNGKTTIYINGKQPIMSSSSVIQMLKASPPGRIKRIEVWVQPGVAYRDEGAILNVVLAPQKGTTGTADMTVVHQSDRFSFTESGWIGHERDKWQFSGSVYLTESAHDYKSRVEMTTFNPADGLVEMERTSDAKYKTRAIYSQVDFGVSRDLGHNNSLGVSLMYQHNWKGDSEYTNDNLFPVTGTHENIACKEHTPYKTITANINYDHKLDSLGSRLTGRLIYSHYGMDAETKYTPESMMFDNSYTDGKNSIEGNLSWTKAFSTKGGLTLGFDIFHDRIKRTMNQSETPGATGGDMPLIDDFRQNQTNFDLFAQGEYRFSNLFSLSLGLTGRWYRRDTHQMLNDTRKIFDDFYIMPELSASFNFNSKNQMTLGYSSNVSQPYYADTNPLVHRSSSTQITTGNPYLKAVTTHSINLSYLLLQKISLGGSMDFMNHLSFRTNIPVEENLIANMPVELGKNRDASVFISYSDAFFARRWSVMARTSFSNTHTDSSALYDLFNVNSVDYSTWSIFLMSSVSIGTDRSWILRASIYYNTPGKKPLSNTPSYTNLTATVSKRFPFGGTLTLYGENLLNCKRDSWYDCPEYSRHGYDLTNGRRIMLRLSMTFGKNIRLRYNPSRSLLEGR